MVKSTALDEWDIKISFLHETNVAPPQPKLRLTIALDKSGYLENIFYIPPKIYVNNTVF